MKVSKEYLKKLIKESLQEVDLSNLEADAPAPGKSAADAMKAAQTAPVKPEKREPIEPDVQKLSAIYSDAWAQLNDLRGKLDVLVKNMAQAGRMLKVQLEEKQEQKDEE